MFSISFFAKIYFTFLIAHTISWICYALILLYKIQLPRQAHWNILCCQSFVAVQPDYTNPQQYYFTESEMATKNKFGARNISALFDEKILSDVKFILKNKNGTEEWITAHKVILASTTPAFKSMFFGGLMESGDIRITDATAEGFAEFLQLFYKSEVNFTIENIAEVAALIDKYNMTDCFETVETFLRNIVTIENVCLCYEITSRFQLSDQLNNDFKTMIRDQSKETLHSSSFRKLNKETVIDIFKWDYLSCDEKRVFDAAIAWSRDASDHVKMDSFAFAERDIKMDLREVIKHIRFQTMTLDEFQQILRNHHNLLDAAEVNEIIDFIKGGNNPRLENGWRSPKSLLNTRDDLILINSVQSSNVGPQDMEESAILFKGSKENAINKVSIYRLELNLSIADAGIDWEEFGFAFFPIGTDLVWIRKKGFRKRANPVIDDCKVWYNPRNRRYVCDINPPLEIEVYYDDDGRDKKEMCPLFTLDITHPSVPSKTQQLKIENGIFKNIEIDCSQNFAVASIGLTAE